MPTAKELLEDRIANAIRIHKDRAKREGKLLDEVVEAVKKHGSDDAARKAEAELYRRAEAASRDRLEAAAKINEYEEQLRNM